MLQTGYNPVTNNNLLKRGGARATIVLCLSVRLASVSAAQELTPRLVFSTYFGGSGTETPREIRFDSTGNIVVATLTESPAADFPTAQRIGPLGGGKMGYNVLVAKFTADASRLLWMTLIGGSAKDYVIGFDLDANDNIYVAGATGSSDFPTTPRAYDRTHNGGTGDYYGKTDAFALKLTPDGSRLVYSTFLGGSNNDVGRGGTIVDKQGCAYIYAPFTYPHPLVQKNEASSPEVSSN